MRNRSTPVPRVNTENERSLCFLVELGGFHYLIGGDTIGRRSGSENARVEEAIAELITNQGIHLDVLHVNHHGANNASDADFLAAIAPEVAIISLGNGNGHRHPRRDTLQRLAAAGVERIYQTEWGSTVMPIPGNVRPRQAIVQGDLILVTDGSSYEIRTVRRFQVDD